MAYPTITRDDLAYFTGRPVASFPQTFVEGSAIPQALLLFKLATHIVDPSVLSSENQELVRFALLAMADSIHLSAPYQTALASPFNSESIGSYSYSKTAAAVRKGEETGIQWFDLAVSMLSVYDRTTGDFARGGIEVFETHGVLLEGQLYGNVSYLSPSEIEASTFFGYDPNLG